MPEHKYCLRVAPKAAEDLDAIYGYIFNTVPGNLRIPARFLSMICYISSIILFVNTF